MVSADIRKFIVTSSGDVKKLTDKLVKSKILE